VTRKHYTTGYQISKIFTAPLHPVAALLSAAILFAAELFAAELFAAIARGSKTVPQIFFGIYKSPPHTWCSGQLFWMIIRDD
jgi:hypothetical protein